MCVYALWGATAVACCLIAIGHWCTDMDALTVFAPVDKRYQSLCLQSMLRATECGVSQCCRTQRRTRYSQTRGAINRSRGAAASWGRNSANEDARVSGYSAGVGHAGAGDDHFRVLDPPVPGSVYRLLLAVRDEIDRFCVLLWCATPSSAVSTCPTACTQAPWLLILPNPRIPVQAVIQFLVTTTLLRTFAFSG